jgi:putative membrane protein
MRLGTGRILVVAFLLLAGRPAKASAQTPILDDTAILSLLGRLGVAEVECTSYAAEHASLPSTKLLAERLRDEHTAFLVDGKKLAERIDIVLEPAIVSAVADSHSAVLADLHHMSGENFDRAFVDHEITFLQYALNYVTGAMLPAAMNQQLKRLLTEARPLLRQHLELARAAKAQLKRA